MNFSVTQPAVDPTLLARQRPLQPYTEARTIRVYALDAHPLYVRGLCSVLTREYGLQVVGVASTLAEALVEAPTLDPDLLLVGTDLPGSNGAATIAALHTRLPRTRLVGMASSLQAAEARAALAAGAAGYVLKFATAEELRATLVAAYRGQTALSPAVRDALATSGSAATPELHLTRRERDLLALLARGLGNREIADEMGVSIPTVKFHVTNILSKLQVDNRTAAVVKALQQQIVSL